MIAYDPASIKSRAINSVGAALENSEVISKEVRNRIREFHKAESLTPNNYLKILLFGVSAIVPLAIVGLFAPDETSSLYFFTIIYWGIAELLIKQLKLYHSGIEEGIISMATILFCIALNDTLLDGNRSVGVYLLYYAIVFIVLTLVTLRYRMWIFIYTTYFVSFIVIFYFFVWVIFPAYYFYQFGVMGVSLLVFWYSRKTHFRENLFINPITNKLEILSLITAYVAFNPYLTSNIFFEYDDLTLDYFPMFGLNMVITVIVPGVLVYIGSKKRNRLFLNIGVVCAAIALLTLWYYYLREVNQNLFILTTGILLMALGLITRQKLKTNQEGFVSFRIKTQESFNIFKFPYPMDQKA